MRMIISKKAFTLVESLVMSILVALVLMAGGIVFITGQNAFSFTSARAQVNENSRRTLQRVAFELQESGMDGNGNIQVLISDGMGASGSDILQFSVPLCVCGVSPIDSNGNVSRWGAPVTWGQKGCSTAYTLNNGLVDICHLVGGNPNNTQNLSVNLNQVKAHLAHGDYIGICSSCDPNSYNNNTIDYRIDSSGRLLRQVMAGQNVLISSEVMADHLTDFQASLNTDQTIVTITIGLSINASQGRTITITKSIDIFLRNRG